ELPNGEYDFSLMRHFLFDTAEAIRFDMLTQSAYKPLAELSVKIRAELRYHTLHANTWIKKLGTATDESIARMQSALNEALPYALGIFEESPFEEEIKSEGLFAGEKLLQNRWMEEVERVIRDTRLQLPAWSQIKPVLGGRIGKHSEHLQPLLDEMSEVFRSDPGAEW
ncbi:MAG: phenylacetate-CoA oxygenase subunit PaaC, partial [Cyclobacteriaceae bacterium]|nr:phenylacetate-CoA oxygenase subunit PaaC [Cyclobacteriaceae bacterium]